MAFFFKKKIRLDLSFVCKIIFINLDVNIWQKDRLKSNICKDKVKTVKLVRT